MDSYAKKFMDLLELRTIKTRQRKTTKDILIKKIAQLLVESKATCSELPEIFKAVMDELTVTLKI